MGRKRKVGRPKKVYRKSNYMKVPRKNFIKVGKTIKVLVCPHCGSLLKG